MLLNYYRESEHRLVDKHLALREQAMMIHQAVTTFPSDAIQEKQQFIDSVCERMSDVDSPGHHIVVEFDGKLYQSHACHTVSYDRLLAMRSASYSDSGKAPDSDLLVGRYSEGNVSVYLAAQMGTVRAEIRQEALARALLIGVFGVFLAIAVSFAIRRLVHFPLRRLTSTIDRIAAGEYGQSAGNYETAELSQVAAAVDVMSESLAKAAAHRLTSITRARRVQENLLPQTTGTNAGHIAFFHRAAEDVAGDYLDVFPTKRGTTVLCVADVVGHGIASAMIAAMLKVLMLEAAETCDTPGGMISVVNRRLIEVGLPEAFATMFLAEWRPAESTLHYVNAGHEPALLVSQQATSVFLEASGPMIGIDTTAEWETGVVKLASGDIVTCWTDGITEARNASDALLGRDRLISAIEKHGIAAPQDVINLVDQALMQHASHKPPADDQTVLAVRFA